MSRLASVIAAAVGALALGGCGGGNACGPARGLVAHVIDGDTIELESGDRIRYLMVDAPESTTSVECFGDEATALNRALVGDRWVELRYDRQCADRFGRLLAYVFVDGHEVNQVLVQRGYACVLHIPPDGDDRLDEFNALEDRARLESRGLWGYCSAAPPRCAQSLPVP